MTQQEPYVKALPVADPETQNYWDGCKEHELRIPCCGNCGRFHFWPRAICPHCQSNDIKLVGTSGQGVVHTFTIVRQNGMPGWRDELPYVVAIVEINDASGVQLMTNIVGCDPESVRIGMPVQVEWQDVTENITLPKFRPIQ